MNRWRLGHALLAATDKLRVIAAILPGPWHPAVLAKQISTISHLTNGRIAVNIVSGWFRSEFTAIGEPWLEHDERYRRSEEFIDVLKGIRTQDNFTYKGDFYRFHNYSLKPKPLQQPRPEIFQGGSSRAARDMASRAANWYFTNGNTVEGIQAQVDDIRAAAAANGHTVNAASTPSSSPATPKPKPNRCWPKSSTTPTRTPCAPLVTKSSKPAPSQLEGEGNWAKSTFEDLVQYNDGFKILGIMRLHIQRYWR